MAHAFGASPALRPARRCLERSPLVRAAASAGLGGLGDRWRRGAAGLAAAATRGACGWAALRPRAPRSRPAAVACRAAGQDGVAAKRSAPQPGADWDAATKQLVSAATVIFFFLLLPQIVKNAGNLMAADLAALRAIAWVGYLTALLGNVILLSYFLDRGEASGARVQAIGAATNIVVLAQVYAAQCMPPAAFCAAAGFMLAAAVINALKWRGALDGGRQPVWTAWLDLLGLVGVSALCQALANTFAGAESQLPGLAGFLAAVALLTLDKTRRLPEGWQGAWRSVPAWSATLLFAFQPVAQLARNLTAPETLAGLSQATVFLAMLGNGLMVPRALLTRDAVWLAGSGWAGLMGWGQVASLYLGRTPDGARYLGLPALAAATIAYFAFNAAVLRQDMRAKGLPARPGSLGRLLDDA